MNAKDLFSRAGQYFLVLVVGNLVALFASMFATVTRWFPVTDARPEKILTLIFASLAMILACLIGARKIGYTEREFSLKRSLLSALLALAFYFIGQAILQFAFIASGPAYTMANLVVYGGEKLGMTIPAAKVLPFIPLFYAIYTAFLILGHFMGKKKRDAEKAAMW